MSFENVHIDVKKKLKSSKFELILVGGPLNGHFHKIYARWQDGHLSKFGVRNPNGEKPQEVHWYEIVEVYGWHNEATFVETTISNPYGHGGWCD